MQRYGYQYLWPDRSWWNNLINLPLTWLVHVGATGFATHYLETRRRMPLLHGALAGGTLLMGLPAGLALGDHFNQLQNDRLALERQAREMQTAYAATLEHRVEERTQELRKAMQQVSAALELEQRAQLEQREFLATVSHELRTPLTVIDTVAQNLELEAVDADAQTRRRYEKILQATRRLAILLDN